MGKDREEATLRGSSRSPGRGGHRSCLFLHVAWPPGLSEGPTRGCTSRDWRLGSGKVGDSDVTGGGTEFRLSDPNLGAASYSLCFY